MNIMPLEPEADVWLHILFGDSRGGGHLHGQGIEGKTEFPSYWNLSRIEKSIRSAQENFLARNDSLNVGPFEELVDGILLRVVIERGPGDELRISTVHPLRGNGVFRNVDGKSVSMPLLRQDRRK